MMDLAALALAFAFFALTAALVRALAGREGGSR